MQFDDTRLGKAAVVDVAGRLDAASAPLFETHCDKVFDRGEKIVIIDFDDLEYLSSAGLRVILKLNKRARAAGGRLLICGVKGPVKEIFDISGFSTMFFLYPTLEAAAKDVL